MTTPRTSTCVHDKPLADPCGACLRDYTASNPRCLPNQPLMTPEEIDEILMNAEDETYSTPPVDIVNRPPHYNQSNDIECIDAMRAAYGDEALENHCVMNAFKYLWRARHKGGDADLRKAIWYLRMATGDDPREGGV